VHEMKFPPLLSGERAEHMMIEHPSILTELQFGLCDRRVHISDLCSDIIENLLGRQAFGSQIGGCFPAFWQLLQAQHKQPANSILPIRRPRQRLTPGETLLKSSRCPRVGQIQVLKNLAGAPLARDGPLRELFGRQAAGGFEDTLLESFKTEIHSARFPFI